MRLAFALTSLTLAACGLSIVGVASDGVTDGQDAAPAPVVDGTAPVADSAPDGDANVPPIADAGRDADAALPLEDAGNGCTTATENFTTIDPTKWQTMGASLGSGGGVVLTKNDQSNQVNGIWTKTALPIGSSIHVAIKFTDDIPNGASDGDGIAIAWASATGLGGTDNGLGICASNLDGVASLLYTATTQRVQVATDIKGTCQTIGSVPATVGANGALELMVTKSGSTTAQTGPGNTQTTNAGPVPQTGFIGVTASTGNTARSNFTLTSITIESCP